MTVFSKTQFSKVRSYNSNCNLGQEEVLDQLLPDWKIKLFLPEDKIIRQGDRAESLFFLAQGECDVLVSDEMNTDKYTATLKPSSYFGEVALIKNCTRTASVYSKNYTTCAELKKEIFEKLLKRFQFLKDSMEHRIYHSYNDKWKKFKKRCIRNIDYMSYGISDRIIEEITYMFDLVSIKQGDFLFKAGQPCRDIHIISRGEINIYVHNNTKETFIDTLYTGCTIGAYWSLLSDEYSMSGRAKTDLTLLRLPFTRMQEIRESNEDLDRVMCEYEHYVEENGLPYCDYKVRIFRNNSNL